MDNKKNRKLFVSIVYIATLVVTLIGSTFAYFSAMTQSNENAVSLNAAEFKLALEDDTSLIKAQIIPTAEKYVDLAINRLDTNGKFIEPYEENGKTITDKTVCIDDNLNEICSVYTFTIVNPMTDMDLPVQLIFKPTVNTFTNMKYKVIKVIHDEEKGYQVSEITKSKWLVDDRYEIDSKTGGYVKDEFGHKIEKSNFNELEISNITVDGFNEEISKATNATTPTKATYSIVMWVEEIGEDQTTQDSGQIFAGGIIIETKGTDGNGITGVFTAGGVDNE